MHPSVHCSIIFSGQGMETTSASTDEWIKKCDTQITHTHWIEYYSAIKKNESLPFVDRAWGHYAKWSIRQRKTATVWFHLYVASENKPKHNKLKKKKRTQIQRQVGGFQRWGTGDGSEGIKTCRFLVIK